MDYNILERAIKSRNLQNLDSAIFQISFFSHSYKDFLLGIFYLEQGNYTKSINYFEKYNTVSSAYFQGIAFKKSGKYTCATHILKKILKNSFKFDEDINPLINQFFVSSYEYIYEELGECLTKNFERNEAIPIYKESYKIYPLINVFENLYMENIDISNYPTNIPESKYFQARELFNRLMKESNFKELDDYVNRYKVAKNISKELLLSHVAKELLEANQNERALSLFEWIHKNDSDFLKNMDFYSSVLWQSKERIKLASLTKHLLIHHKQSYITYIVLGNFFSLNDDIPRALTCLNRSNLIEKNWYAYAISGYEYCSKQNYQLALTFFKNSCKMYLNNYNAIYGMGNVYGYLKKTNQSIRHLNTSMVINPLNEHLKILVLKNFIKLKEYSSSYKIISKALNLDKDTPIYNLNSLITRVLSKTEELYCLEYTSMAISQKKFDEAASLIGLIKNKTKEYLKIEKSLRNLQSQKLNNK